MRNLQEDLLLAILGHVTFDIETGCWYVPAHYERRQDIRWVSWSAFYANDGILHTLLDQPWCLNYIGSLGLTNYIHCINPAHNSAPSPIFQRYEAMAAA